MLIAALLFGCSARAEQVVEIALPDGEAAKDIQMPAVVFEGEKYTFSDEAWSFESAYAFHGEAGGGVCEMTVPGEQVAQFK